VVRLLLGLSVMLTRNFARLACSVFTALFLSAQVGSAQELYPNLVPLPASQFSIVIQNSHVLLRFGATSWNNGAGPLELRAGTATSQGQNVFQRIYRDDGSYTEVLAGTFIWHPTHDHFHFADFALYTLQAVGAQPGSEQTSSKTSFCVMDTTKVNTTIPNASNSATYTTCNKVVQGMSVGWGDTYGPTLTGQSFDITGFPDGYYDLTIESDPNDRLIETNELDNVSCVRLHINAVVSPPIAQAVGTCGNVTISGITPSQISKGTSISVRIAGSGFAAGMAVGFENGSGPAPVVSNVNFTATEITATVSVKSGGSRTTRYWDLRVGPALWYRALAVVP